MCLGFYFGSHQTQGEPPKTLWESDNDTHKLIYFGWENDWSNHLISQTETCPYLYPAVPRADVQGDETLVCGGWGEHLLH